MALGKALAELGLPLLRLRGEVVDVLEALRQALPLAAIHSHQETGNALSYARDRAVAQWSRAHDIAWHEYPQMAVFRGGKRGHDLAVPRDDLQEAAAPPAVGDRVGLGHQRSPSAAQAARTACGRSKRVKDMTALLKCNGDAPHRTQAGRPG